MSFKKTLNICTFLIFNTMLSVISYPLMYEGLPKRLSSLMAL